MTGPQPVPPRSQAGAPTEAVPGAVTGQPTGDLGDPMVEAAIARLDAADGIPAGEQVTEYEAVHRALQDTLATVDEA